MTDINISAKDQHRFSKPDPDFSAKRNRDIIKRTIENADKVREKNKKEYKEGLLERSDLIYSYINHIYGAGGNGDKTLYDYAGRENVMRLLGEQKRREIMQRKFIYGQNINNIKE
jgi:hypothetical protein